MPLIRPPLGLRASPLVRPASLPPSAYNRNCGNARALSAAHRLAAADHGSHYDPPTGWLFGVKPGEKYEKEGWETVWMWGFFGSLGLAAVAYAFKPDTSYVFPPMPPFCATSYCILLGLGLTVSPPPFWSCRIQTWALEEARRRLEAEGILSEPDDKS
jgi:hypothetical protein